jgi:drug/metabolite transporter (DMT)-like permease
MFSGGFILYYGGSLLILAVYAVLWQQILKKFPLTTAYSNRPLATILGMLWGAIFFHENITINQVAGAVVIILGIRMAVRADGQ